MLAHHRHKLTNSAITDAIASKRGYQSIISPGELARLGFARSQQIVPTLLIPLYNSLGVNVSWQHRPDQPRTSSKSTGEPRAVKYESPANAGNLIDVHPLLRESGRLLDRRIPLYVTEGTIKADAAVSAGLVCVSISGVFNWRYTDQFGGKMALPDWESIPLNDRLVYLVFDSDAAYKRGVFTALRRLAEFLTLRGAIIKFIYLPEQIQGQKVGLDDFLHDNSTSLLAEYVTDKIITVAKYDTTLPIAGYELSNGGNADRLLDKHEQELRYMHLDDRNGTWLHYDGSRWEPGQAHLVQHLAQQIVIGMYGESEHEKDADKRKTFRRHTIRSDTHQQLRDMVQLAQTRRSSTLVPATLFNRQEWLLNVANGTIDLRTGELHEHDEADYITKVVPTDYRPGYLQPDFKRFIDLLTNGNERVRNFLWHYSGYALTGSTKEGSLLYLKGETRTGKSTFAMALLRTLGDDYAWKGNFTTFLARRSSGGPRNDVATMQDKRLVVASEVEKSERFASSLLKELTGGEVVNARKLYQEERQIQPTVKFLFTANEFPFIHASDTAAWGRINLVEIGNLQLQERQYLDLKHWIEYDQQAHEAMLSWAIDGCLAWQEDDSLMIPDTVHQSTATQRAEFEPLTEFLAERCVVGEHRTVRFSRLYDEYKDMYRTDKGYLLGRNQFRDELIRSGFPVEARNQNVRYAIGIAIRFSLGPDDATG